MTRISWISAFLILSKLVLSYAQAPAGGISVLGSYPASTFRLHQNSGEGSYEKVRVNHSQFEEALQLSTLQAPNNPWDIQLSAFNKMQVKEGDVMLLTFFARMISSKDETGQASLGCVFEKASPDYDKSLFRNVNPDAEWKLYNLPFTCKQDFDLAEAQINFQIGTSKAQVIQIANIQLLNYRDKITLEKLPKTEYTYQGREPDAAWRKKAEENINRYRKAGLTIDLKSRKGRPMEEYTLDIRMTAHAFGWGTCVDAQRFITDDTYKKIYLSNFNKAVFENDMKWPEWQNEVRKQTMFKALDTLLANGKSVRGHCMVWPSWRWLPGSLRAFEKDPERLKKEINNHIQDIGSTVGTKVSEWDVLNEPFTNVDITNIAGEDLWAKWFFEARKVCPQQKLYINDFSIFEGGGNDVAHQNHYYNTIKKIKEAGAPIDGIGYQSHFAAALTSPEKIWQILDRFNEFKLEMQVTEFDVDVEDEILQADYTRDFMTAMFAYPAMTGFLTWGYWENAHWKPQAAMYRNDWSIKPNGKIWQELIYKTWWTSFQRKATSNITERVFKGSYMYTLKDKSGKVIKQGTFEVSKDTSLQIEF
ncbi:MAG: endo-1,4-beta-xylanase [Cytophagaceae bacterium]|jgi:GH35 family endo-1,4-beta-xylanase|nr:endo-1,4-beta-xylanase [Cytophagaceae bacterium]